nr:MAG TPA: hypothetical protein [Caudoviricetes sp.]
MNYTIFKQIIYIICISVCSKIAICYIKTYP